MSEMRRREFITLLGGATAAWPLPARAQQPDRLRRIGVLMGIAESDPARPAFLSAFTRALQDLGWRDGANIRIDYRWGAGDSDRIRSFARELVELKPDLIVGQTTPVVAAHQQQTRTIPIVFIQVSDPVGSGFIAGIAEPGGNITGFTNLESSMSSKLLELLKEIAPGITRVALLFNPETAPDGGSYFLRPVEAAAPALKVKISGARSQRRRNRRGDRGACTRARRRPDRHAGRFRPRSSRADPGAGRAVSLARGLRLPVLRGGRRPDILWNGSRRSVSPRGALRRPHP